MDNPVDLSGRVALVTGGTRGIGLGIARALAAAGASVVVCGRNEPLSLPQELHFAAADVRDPEQARLAVDAVLDRHGRLDVLVNNAGGAPPADAATVSPRFVRKVVELNLLAPFYVSQAANARMQRQESGGEIISIGSVAARQAEPRSAAYSAAKAGLLQLTRALALEWAPKVRVNHLTVGPVLTASAARFYGSDGGAPVAATIAMGRLAEPSDIAAACLFLASPLAGYVTGADLAVHGGGEVPARYLAANPGAAAPGGPQAAPPGIWLSGVAAGMAAGMAAPRGVLPRGVLTAVCGGAGRNQLPLRLRERGRPVGGDQVLCPRERQVGLPVHRVADQRPELVLHMVLRVVDARGACPVRLRPQVQR